jgi:two-component system response regulator DesR
VKVLVADDEKLARQRLVRLLGEIDGVTIVAECTNADEVLAAVKTQDVDVALLDIEMPGMDGIAAAAQLARELPGTRSLIVTTFGRPGYLRRAIESGAGGFLLKDAPAAELAAAIREVHAGRRVIDPGLAGAAIADGVSPLTERERDVLVAARTQATAAEIARRLYLSEGTVRNYLSAAIRKLGARNRAEAIRIADEKGWL